MRQFRVEGGSEGGRGREAGGRQAAGDPDVVAFVGLLAQPVRAVRQRDRGDAEPRDWGGVPEVRPQAQRRLLLQGQLAEQRCDVQRCRHGGGLLSGEPGPAATMLGIVKVIEFYPSATGSRNGRSSSNHAMTPSGTIVRLAVYLPAAAASQADR